MPSVSARQWPHQSSPTSGSEYLPAIDGLRAVAVAAVVAYHLGLPWARGGFLGVDLFFVLSGFLITGLLLREREQTGRIDLAHFYRRRARRLLPALFLMLAAVSAWVAATGTAADVTSLRADAVAAVGYVANWRLVLSHSGYFAQFSAPSPLRHAWSLAIEEQYYLIWPLLLLGLMRGGRGSRRATVMATVAMAALSATAMAIMYHPGHDPSRIYYGTDTRVFELLVGALLALLTTARPASGPARPIARRAATLVGPLALATLLFAAVTVHDDAGWMYQGGFVGCSLLAAAVVWSVGRAQPGRFGAALAVRPLRWMGRISYGIYLWHWPVIDLLTPARTGLSRPASLLTQVAVTMILSTASFYVVERPIRLGRIPKWPALVAAPLGACLALTFLTVAPARTVKLATSQHLALAPVPAPPVTSLASSEPVSPASGRAPSPTSSMMPVAPPSSDTLTGVRTPSAGEPLRVLMVGDSVMWDASLGIKAALEATGEATVDDRAVLGFGLTRSAYAWRTAWPSLIAADRPDVVIAMFGGWDAAQVGSKGPSWYAALLDQAIGTLSSSGARIVFLEYPRNRPPDVPGQAPVDQASNERLRELVNGTFAGAAQRHTGTVTYLPVSPALDLNGEYSAFLPGADGVLERVRKHDNIHICPAGSARLGALVLHATETWFSLPAADPRWLSGAWRSDVRFNLPQGACA